MVENPTSLPKNNRNSSVTPNLPQMSGNINAMISDSLRNTNDHSASDIIKKSR
jgi:hypothetical protein